MSENKPDPKPEVTPALLAQRIDRRMGQIWEDLQRGRKFLEGASAETVIDFHAMEHAWMEMHSAMTFFIEGRNLEGDGPAPKGGST